MKNLLECIEIPKRYKGRVLSPTINIGKIVGSVANPCEPIEGYYLSGFPGDICEVTVEWQYASPEPIDVRVQARLHMWIPWPDGTVCWSPDDQIVTVGGAGDNKGSIETTFSDVIFEPYPDSLYSYDMVIRLFKGISNDLYDDARCETVFQLLQPFGAQLVNIKNYSVY